MSQPTTPSTQPPGKTLTEKTARGFVYLLAQTVGNLVVNFGQQVALAWFLEPAHFGLFGMATVVNAIALVIQFGGVRDVLIIRHVHFKKLANAGFWLSMAIGVAGMGLMFALAEAAAWWYGTREVVPLIHVMAAVLVLGSLSVVPEARLRGQLRFRAIAAIDFAWIAGIAVVSVILAWRGWGALSFVMPRLFIDPLRFIVLAWLARPPLRWTPHVRLWRRMLPDSLRLLGAGFVELVIEVGDYLVLGRFHGKAITGIYFFAYGISRRPMALFNKSVAGVLFPALSTLRDELRRQVDAFIRAASLLALLSTPVCALGVAAADPAIRAFFPEEKWLPAVPVLQVLCVSTSMKIVGFSARALMKAQGRLKLFLGLSIAYAGLFITLVSIAAVNSTSAVAPLSVAAAVLCCSMIMEPLFVYLAIHPGGGCFRDVTAMYGKPIMLSALAFAPAWIAGEVLPPMPGRDWIRLAVISAVGGAIYLLGVWKLAPEAWSQFVQRFRGFLKTR